MNAVDRFNETRLSETDRLMRKRELQHAEVMGKQENKRLKYEVKRMELEMQMNSRNRGHTPSSPMYGPARISPKKMRPLHRNPTPIRPIRTPTYSSYTASDNEAMMDSGLTEPTGAVDLDVFGMSAGYSDVNAGSASGSGGFMGYLNSNDLSSYSYEK